MVLSTENLLELVTTLIHHMTESKKPDSTTYHGIRHGEPVKPSEVWRENPHGETCNSPSQMESGSVTFLEESNNHLLGLMSYCVVSHYTSENTTDNTLRDLETTVANWNLYLFDGFGSFDPDIIYNRIEYLQQDSIQKYSWTTCQSLCLVS